MEKIMYKLVALLAACAILASSAYACTAFFKHEYTSGMNKVCTYDHLGSDYVITVKSYQLCPITVIAPH